MTHILALLAMVLLLAPAQASAQATEAAPAGAPAATPAVAAPEGAPVASLPAISVSTVGKHLMRDRVLASGLVAPVQQVQVQPLIEGQPIEALLADVGDTVTAGQVLAQLSSSTLELQKLQLIASRASASATIAQADAQLLEARATAAEAARVNDRTAALRKQGASSQAAADQASSSAISASARVSVAVQSLEAARAQATLVEAQVENIDLQLTRTSVATPVAGEVVARNAQLGGIASASGLPMFVIIRDGALELRADLSERDVLRVDVGQKVAMTLVNTSEPLSGTLRMIEPQIDAVTRLGRARISVDMPERLRSGMFVDAEILIAERETIAVPVTAVGASEGEATVMRVVDGIVERLTVETGIRDAGMVEIVSGLAIGDIVVTKAAAFVRDGDRINPVPNAVDTN